MPWAGNRLTVREYQTRWLDMLEFVTGAPLGFRLSLLPPELRFLAGIPPEVPARRTAAAGDRVSRCSAHRCVAPPRGCASTTMCADGTDADHLRAEVAAGPGRRRRRRDRRRGRRPDLGRGDASRSPTPPGRTYRYSGFNDDSPGTTDGAAHPRLPPHRARPGRHGRCAPARSSGSWATPIRCRPTSTAAPAAATPCGRTCDSRIYDADGTQLDADSLAVASRSAARRATSGSARGRCRPTRRWRARRPRATGEGRSTPSLNGQVHDQRQRHRTATGNSALIVPPEGLRVGSPPTPFGPGAARWPTGSGVAARRSTVAGALLGQRRPAIVRRRRRADRASRLSRLDRRGGRPRRG